MNVLTVNLVFSTLVFWIAAKLYVFPRLHELQARTVLVPIFLLHSLRHLARVYQPDMQKLLPSRCWSGDERLQDV